MNSNSQNNQSALTQSPSKENIGSLLDDLDEETRAKVLGMRYIKQPLVWSKIETEKNLQQSISKIGHYDSELGHFVRTAFSQGKQTLGPMGGVMRTGHILITVDGYKKLESRLVCLWVLGFFPPKQIDHINGDPSDNHIHNLRLVDSKLNNRNSAMRSHNKSGYTGVIIRTDTGKARAFIKVDGKQITIGNFATALEAHKAREAWIAAHPELGFTSRHGK